MKWNLRVYLIIFFLLLTDIAAYFYFKYSLAGYYSDCVLIWIWFWYTIYIIISYRKKLLAKIYMALLLLGLVLSVIPMMLPISALLLSSSPYGLWLNKNLNDRYRVQIVGYSIMNGPGLQLIEKHGLLEKEVFSCFDQTIADDRTDVKIRHAKDVRFVGETDTSVTLTLFYGGPDKTISFDKKSGRVVLVESWQ